MDDLKIVIGAGTTKYDGWISTSEEELNVLDKQSMKNYLRGREVDAFLAEHVWEHFTLEDGKKAAKLIYKFLKPGGYIRCAVPDKNFDNEWYQNMVQIGGPGPKEHPANGHKIVYDYETFAAVFQEAGFEVELLEYCDENHQFHYNDWDEEKGMIGRSYRFDTRNNEDELGMVSIILDAYKPSTR